MAKYEYLDIEEYGDYIVDRAKVKLLYNSNISDSKKLDTILLNFFTDAYNIIKKWRKLKNDDEFLSQKWDTEITDFVVNSYRTMGDELLNSSTINGIGRSYRISPVAQLKSSIPQCM